MCGIHFNETIDIKYYKSVLFMMMRWLKNFHNYHLPSASLDSVKYITNNGYYSFKQFMCEIYKNETIETKYSE